MADALLVGSHLEDAFNVAEIAADEQGVLHAEKLRNVEKEEGDFFGAILLQRDQEIHQLQIKKKAMLPKSLTKRKAEKEAKAAMLAKSLVKEGNTEATPPPVQVKVFDGEDVGEAALGPDSSVEVMEEKKE
jgi:hypothetical protein